MPWTKAMIACAAIAGLLVSMPLVAQKAPWPARTPAHTPTTASDPLQEAEALLQAQQFAQAEEKLKALSESQARNPQFWFDLAFAQSHQGKTQDAVVAYQKAVELAPDWFEANVNLGMDLLRGAVGDANSVRAVPVLQHAVTLKPTSGGNKALANAWFWLARALEWKDPKGSAEAYDKAAELNPADPELLASAGATWARAGDPAGAEQRLKKAAEAGSVFAMAKLTVLLSGQQRYAEAADWFKKQDPHDATSLGQLAVLLVKAGKKDEAITTLEKARTVSPDPEIDRALAALYMDTEQYDKAAPILQDLTRKNPGDSLPHWLLGRALIHQHKYFEGEAEMLAALKLNAQLQSASDAWELAFAAQQNKHYELAIRVLDARAQHAQETPATYWIRAVSYDSLGAFKPAAENYKLFLAASGGKSPDQEFQARHRLKAITPQ